MEKTHSNSHSSCGGDCSDTLKDSEKLLLHIARASGGGFALQHASERIRAKRCPAMLACVSKGGTAIHFAADALKADPHVVAVAARGEPTSHHDPPCEH